jgi:PPK2 family polyphosphate:nucleotide phosphotransferase
MTDQRYKRLAEFLAPLRVEPGRKVVLGKDFDPKYKADFLSKEDGEGLLEQGVEIMSEYQARLAAQDTYGVLLCLQALDAAGKDGTIRHVMSGVNPQGVFVHSFKAPSSLEIDHDYLWRAQLALPRRGDITIFNRSHYEEVLVVRVHPQILEAQKLPKAARGKDVWRKRYRDINGFVVVKIFLNLSKGEQRKRFMDRLDVPDKNWKFSAADAKERTFWDDYQKAYSEMLSNTSTEWAPWYVVPADRKWFARICVSAIMAYTLMTIDPQYPVLDQAAKDELVAVKGELEAEAE